MDADRMTRNQQMRSILQMVVTSRAYYSSVSLLLSLPCGHHRYGN